MENGVKYRVSSPPSWGNLLGVRVSRGSVGIWVGSDPVNYDQEKFEKEAWARLDGR